MRVLSIGCSVCCVLEIECDGLAEGHLHLRQDADAADALARILRKDFIVGAQRARELLAYVSRPKRFRQRERRRDDEVVRRVCGGVSQRGLWVDLHGVGIVDCGQCVLVVQTRSR